MRPPNREGSVEADILRGSGAHVTNLAAAATVGSCNPDLRDAGLPARLGLVAGRRGRPSWPVQRAVCRTPRLGGAFGASRAQRLGRQFHLQIVHEEHECLARLGPDVQDQLHRRPILLLVAVSAGDADRRLLH